MGAARYLSFVRRLQRAPACWQRGSTMCTRASTSLAKGCLRQGAKNVRVSFVFCFCATARASYGLQNSAKFQSGTQMMDGCASVNEPVPRGTEHGTREQGGNESRQRSWGHLLPWNLHPPFRTGCHVLGATMANTPTFSLSLQCPIKTEVQKLSGLSAFWVTNAATQLGPSFSVQHGTSHLGEVELIRGRWQDRDHV